MAALAQASSSKKQSLPGLAQAPGPPPNRPSAATATVQLIDAPSYVGPPQPTTADLLKAIQDLGGKIHQLSKNQKALEARLDQVRKTTGAIDHNVIVGATWLRNWDYLLFMNLDDPPQPFMTSGINTPHWK